MVEVEELVVQEASTKQAEQDIQGGEAEENNAPMPLGTQEVRPQPAVVQEPVAPSPLIVQSPQPSGGGAGVSALSIDSPSSAVVHDNISPLPTTSPNMGMGGPDSPGETMMTGRTLGTSYDPNKWDGKRSYTTHSVMDRRSAERFGLAMSQEMKSVKSQSRIEVRVISGTHLLASDPNGKSDPVCFLWFGSKGNSPLYTFFNPN